MEDQDCIYLLIYFLPGKLSSWDFLSSAIGRDKIQLTSVERRGKCTIVIDTRRFLGRRLSSVIMGGEIDIRLGE